MKAGLRGCIRPRTFGQRLNLPAACSIPRFHTLLVSPTPYSCSKAFSGYPCCHRQWRHQGHCRFVHGYSRSFNLWFAATELDACTELFRVIEGRREQPEEGSYTNKLLAGGDNSILKKIGEESAEFVMACKDDNAAEIAGEAADIVFHMQVALAHHGVSWRQVQEVLAARRGAPRRH